MVKLLVLDRDGVINEERPDFVKSADEWVPYPSSIAAIGKLTYAGYRIVIASNQSGLGRGKFGIDALNTMHSKMNRLVAQAGGYIDAVFFCPHTPDIQCECRKPKPGMLIDIAERYHLEPKHIQMVGDSLRDLQAVATIGGQPILVLTGNGEKTRQNPELPENTLIFDDLAAVADYLIAQDQVI
jgi:D-glycero-D-manno-heptose 1,7-bisphosphate phosphatase